jgi:hypothetical protein
MKKALTRLRMVGVFIPSIINDIFESRHFDPKVIETEGLGLFRTTIIHKEERAMVRQG